MSLRADVLWGLGGGGVWGVGVSKWVLIGG